MSSVSGISKEYKDLSVVSNDFCHSGIVKQNLRFTYNLFIQKKTATSGLVFPFDFRYMKRNGKIQPYVSYDSLPGLDFIITLHQTI